MPRQDPKRAAAPRRLRYHHGELRPALLAAALEVLQERGASGVSLREVARRAGVSHAAPAHHFSDKAALLTAVAVQGFERFHTALERAGVGVPHPVAALGATGRAYVQFAARHRTEFELMFRPEHLTHDSPELVVARERAHQLLVQRVVDAQRSGYAPGLSPEDVALAAWSTVHGLATLWLDGNLAAHVTGTLDEVIERVLAASAAARHG